MRTDLAVVNLTAFLFARLTGEQRDVDLMRHTAWPPEDEYFWCPAARPGPIGDLEWGEDKCDCGLAARKARAHAEIDLKLAVFGVIAVSLADDPDDETAWLLACLLAACYAGHYAYQEAWKPDLIDDSAALTPTDGAGG